MSSAGFHSKCDRVWQYLASVTFATVSARGAVVLAFHQIGATKFESWIRLLRHRFALASIDELVTRRRNGQPISGMLALTFDDGWTDTCEPVAAICHRERWPIMIYLVSGASCARTSLWFAELPPLLLAARGRCIAYGSWTLDLSTGRRGRRSTASLIKRLKVLPGEEALEAVCALRVAAGLPRLEERPAFVNDEFVRRYRESEWVKFGSHSSDHQAVAAQPDDGLRQQCAESQRSLESIVRQPIRHFAYPYGAPADVGDCASSSVIRYYDSAVTMVRGVCAGTTDLARIPRVPLYEADGRARMVAKIALAPWI